MGTIMRAIFESLFEICYLVSVITIGILMVKKCKGVTQYLWFGVMAIILGCGDAFHLVPRIIGLCTTGLSDFTYSLGIGKLITSVTMTVFYVILYRVYEMRYEKDNKTLRIVICVLALIRIILCFFPQNRWTDADSPVSWGIIRNIPFVILGAIIVIIYFKTAKEKSDKAYKLMYLAITLSFLFYIPVVLWAHVHPMIGMLMLPKTCMYFWIVMMGFKDMRKTLGLEKKNK